MHLDQTYIVAENPGICKPYECLICQRTIANLKVAVIHVMKRHNVSLRGDSGRPKGACMKSFDCDFIKIELLYFDSQSQTNHLSKIVIIFFTVAENTNTQHLMEPCTKLKIRNTARKSTWCQAQRKEIPVLGTRKFVDEILSTVPISPECVNPYTSLGTMTSQKASDEDCFATRGVVGHRRDSRDQLSEDDDFVQIKTPDKLKRKSYFTNTNNNDDSHAASSEVVATEVQGKKVASPIKAKIKSLPCSGEEKSRHQLTREKRAEFGKRVHNLSKKNKPRLAKKQKLVGKTATKSPKSFRWSSVYASKSITAPSHKVRSVSAVVSSTSDPSTEARPAPVSRSLSAATCERVTKKKNTARKSTRPSKTSDISDDDITKQHFDVIRSAQASQRHQETPSPLTATSSTNDATTTVKKYNSRKSTRSRVTSSGHVV